MDKQDTSHKITLTEVKDKYVHPVWFYLRISLESAS